MARSAVPPPMSTSATPSSFSSAVRTASAAASCSITVSATATPARLTHATMFCVDDEVLRQDVQDLASGRQGHRLRRVDRTPHIVPGDLAVLPGHRDDAATV